MTQSEFVIPISFRPLLKMKLQSGSLLKVGTMYTFTQLKPLDPFG